MSGHFNPAGKSFPVQARPGSTEQSIEIVLPPGLAKLYAVEKKDLPANLPTSWRDPSSQQTHTIHWLNNFGLKATGRPDFEAGRVPEKYEILVEVAEGEQLVYFDGEVKPFPADETARPGNMPGKVAARLDLGDPPIGKI